MAPAGGLGRPSPPGIAAAAEVAAARGISAIVEGAILLALLQETLARQGERNRPAEAAVGEDAVDLLDFIGLDDLTTVRGDASATLTVRASRPSPTFRPQ
jgi:hypothetical protein